MNIQQIDTRHGTANQSNYSNGNCLPYTGVPFGMNYFAPQTTDQKGSWWFHPEDRIFQGYRLTHQPSPWMGDFSHFLMTPVSGTLPENSLFHAQSSYRPEESTFCPTHLSINQLRYEISSTLIPSMYGGVLTIDYHKNDSGLLLTFPERYQLNVVDSHTITGYLINFSGCEDPDFRFHFTLSFEQPLFDTELAIPENSSSILLSFGSIEQQTIRFGTSFISEEQAQVNLLRESAQSPDEYLEKIAKFGKNISIKSKSVIMIKNK